MAERIWKWIGWLNVLGISALAAGCTNRGGAMTERTIRVGVCQTFCIDGDADGNLRRAEYAVETAAAQGAVLVCLPESMVLGWVNPDAHKKADPIPGASSQRLAELAKRYNVMLAVGLDEKDGERLYDSAILIDSTGEILLKHRKINTLPNLMKPPYAEGKPEDVQVVNTRIGRVGVLICADTFLEPVVQGIAEKKPDLLVVPYGWAAKRNQWPEHGKELEQVVGRTAQRAGCAVVGTDLVGMITQGPWTGRTYGGQSVVADRDGKTLAVLRDRDAEVRVLDVPIGRVGG